GVNSGHRGLPANSVHLNHHTHFFRFVHDGSESLHLLFGWPGERGQANFTGEFDTHGGHLAYFGSSVLRSERQGDSSGRDDARSVDHALVNVISERYVPVRWATPRQNGCVAASSSACICCFSFGPVLMCRCASMSPG